MKIVNSKIIDMSQYGKTTECVVHCMHIKIDDVDLKAKEILETIRDTSWINKLGDPLTKSAFKERSKETIEKIVKIIVEKISGEVGEDFGEYLISFSAQDALGSHHSHTKFPLAELFKEKVSGNPGFDFHTESHLNNLIFGEAKYSKKKTPRAIALKQISKFIDQKKDTKELSDLKNFLSKVAIKNVKKNKKGFVAAFSLNSKNVEDVFKKALKSNEIDKLIGHSELYLIAIEI